MNNNDIIRPTAYVDLPGDRKDAVKRALRTELHAKPARQRRWTMPVALGIAGVSLAATGAGVYVKLADTTDRSLVRCYSEQSRDFGDGFPGTSVALSDNNQADPAAQCALVWRDGILRPGESKPQQPDPGRFEGQIPTLQTCVLHNGIAAVFPGDANVCQLLSLPVYTPGHL